jgi:Tfp pilus assembly protein PilE
MELLVVVAIIGSTAALVQPALASAYRRARITVAKVRMFHDMRIETFSSETVGESDLMWLATNTPKSFAPDHYIWQPPRRPVPSTNHSRSH